MADRIVSCPECDARLRIPPDKVAVRCPKCKAAVRLPQREDDDEEMETPSLSRRSSRSSGPPPPPPLRSRRREDDDEDDRPTRKKRKRQDDDDQGEGPWVIAAVGAVAALLLTLRGCFALYGRIGLAPGQDGPTQKLIGLGIGLVVALILMPLGVFSVKNKVAYGRWHSVTGTTAIVLGMFQAIFGGLMGGFCLYGLIFALINGR